MSSMEKVQVQTCSDPRTYSTISSSSPLRQRLIKKKSDGFDLPDIQQETAYYCQLLEQIAGTRIPVDGKELVINHPLYRSTLGVYIFAATWGGVTIVVKASPVVTLNIIFREKSNLDWIQQSCSDQHHFVKLLFYHTEMAPFHLMGLERLGLPMTTGFATLFSDPLATRITFVAKEIVC